MLWEKGKSQQLSTIEPKACMPRAASDELQPANNHYPSKSSVQECVLYVTSGKLIPWKLIWWWLISWKKAILYVPLQFILITTRTLLIYFYYESNTADLQVNIMFTAVSKISLQISFSSAFSGNSLDTNSGSCAIHTNSQVTWNKSRKWACQQLALPPVYHTPNFHWAPRFHCSMKARCVVGWEQE